jgi:hypothetical protein
VVGIPASMRLGAPGGAVASPASPGV